MSETRYVAITQNGENYTVDTDANVETNLRTEIPVLQSDSGGSFLICIDHEGNYFADKDRLDEAEYICHLDVSNGFMNFYKHEDSSGARNSYKYTSIEYDSVNDDLHIYYEGGVTAYRDVNNWSEWYAADWAIFVLFSECRYY